MDKGELITYVREHPELTYAQIAQEAGITLATVKLAMSRAGVRRYRRRGGQDAVDASLAQRVGQLEAEVAHMKGLLRALGEALTRL